MSTPLRIELQDVTKSYAQGDQDAVGVESVSLEVPPGELLAMLGPNGAGKTTLAKIICTISSPTSGEVFYNRRSFRSMSGSEQRAIRRSIGYLPESPFAYNKLTGMEYLRFVCEIYGVAAAQIQGRIRRYVDLFDLGSHAERFIQTYSQGTLKKLALMAALIIDPPVLVLDEPTNALDPKAVVLVRELVLELKNTGKTIIISSHNLDVVEDVADRVAILCRGRLAHVEVMEALQQRMTTTGRTALENLYFDITA